MNQNDDHNLNPELHAWTDPELEARIVAWVAGEASPFEIAELERLLAEKPELTIFKRRIEAVHGLVGDALRPDPHPQRLSEERRAKLLATIGAGDTQPAPAPNLAVYPVGAAQRKNRARQWWITGLATAACLMLGLFVAVPAMKDSTFMKKAPMRPDPSQTVLGPPAAPAGDSSQSNPYPAKPQARRAVVKAAAVSVAESADAGQGGARAEHLRQLEKKQQAMVAQAKRERQEASAMRIQMPVAAPAPAPASLSFDAVTAAPSGAQGSVKLALSDSKTLSLNAAGAAKPDLAMPKVEMPQPALGLALSTTGGFADKAKIVDAGTLNRRGGGALDTWNANANLSQQNTATFLHDPRVAQAANSFGTLNYVGQQTVALQENLAGLNVGGMVRPSDLDASALSQTNAATRMPKNNVIDAGTGGVPALQPRNADSDVVKLSAFEVSESKDFGYAAQGLNAEKTKILPGTMDNPLVGSRLNLKLEDAAASAPLTIGGTLSDATQVRPLARADTPVASPAPPIATDAALEARKPAASSARETEPAPRIHLPVPPPSTEETDTAKEPVSTFSLHVSDVSFRLAQAALARGELPERSRIRPEEFYNAFDYGDAPPSAQEKVSCRIEQSAHPFLQQRNLLRIALKVGATGRGAATPLRLTVLLDTSGSMEREDRVDSVRRAMSVLVSLLHANDRITLIGFARTPRLLADALPGDRAGSLVDLVAKTPAEGGTNLEAALQLAGEKAAAQSQPGAENRIVLLTDGAANLGNADPAALAAKVESLRQRGIAFDACGVGLDGMDDEILEALTRKGAGRYYALSSPDDADAGFAQKLAGAFRPAAENVKLQVRFNPARVSHYRLIGFEQHRLNEADFRNDQVAAAELSAEEAAVALYQVEALPQGDGELGEVFVRFRDAASGEMVEHSWPLTYDGQAPAFDRATPSLQLAGTAALMAEKLRGEPIASQFRLATLAPVMTAVRTRYANDARVQELNTMFGQLRRLIRE